MSDININITADEEPKVHMNIMETVPVGKYEEKANKKQSIEDITDFENQYLSAGATQKVLQDKEDVENKTLGGNIPITHPNCTIAEDKYYASLKYLKECFKYFLEQINESGSGSAVDLSDYYTKEEVDAKKEDISNKLKLEDINGDFNNPNLYTDENYLSAKVAYILCDGAAKKVDMLANELPYIYATKEEVGEIAEATAAIIALQNKYIGGETV